MSLVVNTNVGSVNAQRSLAASGAELKTAMERLSSGKKINSAADDAAGFAIAERMTAQIRGLNMATKNANDGLSMLAVIENATNDVTNMLQRMRELAVQAANDTNGSVDRAFLQEEVSQLIEEIDRVATQTQYNGQQILDGSFSNKSLQIGNHPGSNLQFSGYSLRSEDLGIQSAAKGPLYEGFAVTSADQVLPVSQSQSYPVADANPFGWGGGHTIVSDRNGNGTEDSQFAYWGPQFDDSLRAAAIGDHSTHYQEWETLSGNPSNAERITISFQDGLERELLWYDGYAQFILEGPETVYPDSNPPVSVNRYGTSGSLTSVEGGSSVSSIDITLHAAEALGVLEAAISQISEHRASYGALQNRLEYTVSNLMNIAEFTTSARSRIEDADFAAESARLAKAQVLQQTGTAMLAQANAQPQLALSLIR